MQYRLIPLLAAMLIAASSAFATPSQSADSFAKAIRNYSTAPAYVLVGITNAQTGTRKEGCYRANTLRYALEIEHSVTTSSSGYARIEKMALNNRQREFRFRKQTALDQFFDTYSVADLDQVRLQLARFSNKDLIQGFSSDDSELHAIYNRQIRHRYQALRDAIICVLLERGLSAGHGDYVDSVWVVDDSAKPDTLQQWLPEK